MDEMKLKIQIDDEGSRRLLLDDKPISEWERYEVPCVSEPQEALGGARIIAFSPYWDNLDSEKETIFVMTDVPEKALTTEVVKGRRPK